MTWKFRTGFWIQNFKNRTDDSYISNQNSVGKFYIGLTYFLFMRPKRNEE